MSPQEVTNLWNRIIALEARPLPTDYSAIIAKQHQDTLGLQNRLAIYETLFKQITARLDDHGSKINSNKAGLDFLTAQFETLEKKTQNLKPTISLWPWK